MQPLPHEYKVRAAAAVNDNYLTTEADSLPVLSVAAPSDFGGPGDAWSPEDLLVAAVANCFILSFKAVARASKLEWLSINVQSSGLLDKVEGKTRFTQMKTCVQLLIPASTPYDKAEKLLHKADEICLINNSLSCPALLECDILTDP